jgi:hypothetical protein
MTTLDDVFAALAAWRQPSPSSDPFNLSCRVQPGASIEDLEAAGFVGSVPDELIPLWTASRESWLFEDTEYGQWGLHLLSPGDSAARTSVERVSRPGDIRSDDIVLGEFRGDSDLLVYSRSEAPVRRILVTQPLDPRDQWLSVGGTVIDSWGGT